MNFDTKTLQQDGLILFVNILLRKNNRAGQKRNLFWCNQVTETVMEATYTNVHSGLCLHSHPHNFLSHPAFGHSM